MAVTPHVRSFPERCRSAVEGHSPGNQGYHHRLAYAEQMAPSDSESRLRLSIDIVGPHSMNDALGAQAEIRRAVLASVGGSVRIDEVASHEHGYYCEFCRLAVADPSHSTRTIDRIPPG